MATNQNEPTNSDAVNQSDPSPNNAIKDRKTIVTAKRLETVVAVFLGITTLLSAWASWIGHLHGGIQSINFTKSNNMAAESTATYNLCIQAYLADYITWNTLRDYNYELKAAKADGNQTNIDIINDKITTYKKYNISGILAEGVKWMEDNNEDDPFKMPGMVDKYFESAQESVDQTKELLEEGMRDNTKGDSYMLVTVIYSLTLFLLGIVGTFKNLPNRITVLAIAVAFLVFAVVYMFTIPLPTGFENMNFFEFKK
ncbi:MAG: hypothetical protein IJH36_05770 [Clostridia bacterium]|nr:hypothetical protein [Clostridia bacterium]